MRASASLCADGCCSGLLMPCRYDDLLLLQLLPFLRYDPLVDARANVVPPVLSLWLRLVSFAVGFALPRIGCLISIGLLCAVVSCAGRSPLL